jgi:hypothetical protein
VPLPSQSCLRHVTRPAVARCPSCHQSYCRECIVEHDYKLICADCLRALIESQSPARARFRLPLAAVVQVVVGLALIWLGLYCAGLLLQRIPADVHDGLIWTH